MCRAKIHLATVTHKRLDYEGSITIDGVLMEKAGILPGERVEVFNLNNGHRFSTYVIKGEKNSGLIQINGAAARLVEVGDKVIILSYALVSEEEAKDIKPLILYVDEKNKIKGVKGG